MVSGLRRRRGLVSGVGEWLKGARLLWGESPNRGGTPPAWSVPRLLLLHDGDGWNAAWTVDSAVSHDGVSSLRGGTIGNGGASTGGKHALKWEYRKDGVTSRQPDCVWLDQV